MNIAVLGSAFNPPTIGHADVIKQLLEALPRFDKILLVPSYAHAFDKKMMEYDKRVALLHLFAEDIAYKEVKVLAVEHLICHGNKPVYTYDLMDYIQQDLYPEASLSFVIGPDNQRIWHKFYKADEITGRWRIMPVEERVNVRSTHVRQLLSEHKCITDYVTSSVKDYLIKHRESLLIPNQTK